MAKITIYVPDELKAEMDAAPKEPQINWSGLAQLAFELECRRIANRKKGAGKMEAVIERLRASKQKRENKDRVAGHKAGRDWAMTSAEADVLARVAAWVPPESWKAGTWRTDVVSVLAGHEDWDLENEDAFWEDVAGHRAPSDDFILGFAEGAEEVWNEVADKL